MVQSNCPLIPISWPYNFAENCNLNFSTIVERLSLTNENLRRKIDDNFLLLNTSKQMNTDCTVPVTFNDQKQESMKPIKVILVLKTTMLEIGLMDSSYVPQVSFHKK